jgi:RHS repeat-associated protein
LPFGETWTHEGDAKHNPKYNSQELDRETGYYFYNARHYDPEIGRFVTPDTVIPRQFDTQSWNRFTYCANNPIIYKDPTGHEYIIFYYDNLSRDKDGNFRKAAETEAKEMKAKGEKVILKGVSTESEFKNAWKNIKPEEAVTGVSIYSHGSEGSLEFSPKDSKGKKDKANDGSLNSADIKSLKKLDYSKDAEITLHACNSGQSSVFGTSTAQAFADSQGVTTKGLKGYGYFSQEKDTFVKTSKDSKNVYLESYDRGYLNSPAKELIKDISSALGRISGDSGSLEKGAKELMNYGSRDWYVKAKPQE